MEIDNSLLEYKDYVLKIIKRYPEEFHRLPKSMKNDKDVVLIALEHSISTDYIFDLIDDEMSDNWEIRMYKKKERKND